MAADIESMLDMERLQRFLLVAEMGSLTRAAAAQGTTQSALSLQIAGLERACGGRLFYRTGRGVVLTELGGRLQSRAQALLRDAQTLYAEIRSNAVIPHGEVSVGLLPSTTQTMVPVLLRQVSEQFPNIFLRIHEGSNGQLDEWLVSGRVDLAVISRYGPSALSKDEALITIDSWLVGQRNDELTRSCSVKLAQLDGLPLILPSRPNGLRTVLDQLSRDKGIRFSIPIEVDSIPTQKALVTEGFGYTILGEHAVRR
jgi:DNA-binding transcriptional LysR family regulator